MLNIFLFILLTLLSGSIILPTVKISEPVPDYDLKIPEPTSIYSYYDMPGKMCLTIDELNLIKEKPVEFTCGLSYNAGQPTEFDWILAAENALVPKIFIHSEKQLILRAECNGIKYYSWKCHPPDYGSLWKNTLWKLVDNDPNREIQDMDKFNVYIRRDADENGYWICRNSPGFPLYPTPIEFSMNSQQSDNSRILGEDSNNRMTASSTGYISVNGLTAVFTQEQEASEIDIEAIPPIGIREYLADIDYMGSNYSVYKNLIKAMLPYGEVNLYLVEPGTFHSNGSLAILPPVKYKIFRILGEGESSSIIKSIKLGTFNPKPSPHPNDQWFNIYLPESKPVIYLYSEKEVFLDLKIKPENGYITVSDPLYNSIYGWAGVRTRADGRLEYEGKIYDSLYFETEVKGYDIPKEGFVIKKDNLESFFHEKLKYLGLNNRETDDFLEYWILRINKEVKENFLFVTFLPEEQINRVVGLDVKPKPQSVVRVRPYIKPVKSFYSVPEQKLSPARQRFGLTLIEWGGILDD